MSLKKNSVLSRVGTRLLCAMRSTYRLGLVWLCRLEPDLFYSPVWVSVAGVGSCSKVVHDLRLGEVLGDLSKTDLLER